MASLVQEKTAEVPASRTLSDHTKDVIIDLVGGTAGGTASVYMGQPLDTVKVKMQTFPAMYRNAFHCFKVTLVNEGIARGLYAGTVPSLAAQVSENAVLFMANGMCQKGIMLLSNKQSEEDLSLLQKASAGSLAASFSSLTLCPTELVKCKQQAMQEMIATGKLTGVPKHHVGPWYITKEIFRTEGVAGMYRGLTSTFMREMPGYFFFFGGYEVGRRLLTRKGEKADNIGPLRTMACGALAGVLLWVAVFPTDVVKSRVQVQSSSSANFLGTLISVFKNEGFLALYKGLGPTVLRTIPATAMLFLAYETTKKLLKKPTSDREQTSAVIS